MDVTRRTLPVVIVVMALGAGLVSVSGGAGSVVPPVPISTSLPPPQFGRESPAAERRWLDASRPLGSQAPKWASRLYRRSLLVLHRLSDPRTGAIIAGARPRWDHVWPRDAAVAVLALQSSGHAADARRTAEFLTGLDAGGAARFEADGAPVPGRPAAGDAGGWISLAARVTRIRAAQPQIGEWTGRQDYGENAEANFLANAIAGGASPAEITSRFGSPRGLTRNQGGDALDSAAAWAVVAFGRTELRAQARQTLLVLAAESSRFGIPPTEDWTPGEAWTAPTAWTAWALAKLGETKAADRLLDELRRAGTPGDMLPERVSSHDGRPLSTTPLAWAHACAALALRERYPG